MWFKAAYITEGTTTHPRVLGSAKTYHLLLKNKKSPNTNLNNATQEIVIIYLFTLFIIHDTLFTRTVISLKMHNIRVIFFKLHVVHYALATMR